MDAVGNILAARQADRAPWGAATILALILHAAVVGGLLASAFAKPIRYAKPRAVAVRLLRAGAIRAPQVQAPPAPPAPPPAAERPKIEKPVEEEPKPSKDALLLPSKDTSKKKPTPPPISRPGPSAPTPAVQLPADDEETAPGPSTGATAGAGGTAGIGGFKIDQADFKYDYYIEGLQKSIGLNWYRYPPISKPKSPVVHFQILRDGTITDVQLVTPSGLTFVDRNAMRSVYDASPLPPLPADYRGSQLGIQVVFE
jgi:TonB family protein